MKIAIIEFSKYNFYKEITLSSVCKMLSDEGHEILGDKTPMNHSELIQWCKDADAAVFNFRTEDNEVTMSTIQQQGLVAVVRMLFDFKKPLLVSRKKGIWKPLPMLVSILHASEVKDTILVYEEPSELLSEIRKRFIK